MKRLFLFAAAAIALGGCATAPDSKPVDYATIVAATCKTAVAEVAAIQSVSASLSEQDQKALPQVALAINTFCSAPPTDPQMTWVQLGTVLPALTVMFLTYHKTP